MGANLRNVALITDGRYSGGMFTRSIQDNGGVADRMFCKPLTDLLSVRNLPCRIVRVSLSETQNLTLK